jgi:hypothetical protein
VLKCGEVLQCIDGPSNKVSGNSIRRHIDNVKLLLIYSLGSKFINVYMVVFLFNTVIYVFYCYVCVFLLYV